MEELWTGHFWYVPLMFCNTQSRFRGFSLALSQNGTTKLVVCIYGGQSTVPPLRSSLLKNEFELRKWDVHFLNDEPFF